MTWQGDGVLSVPTMRPQSSSEPMPLSCELPPSVSQLVVFYPLCGAKGLEQPDPGCFPFPGHLGLDKTPVSLALVS